MFYHLFYPNVFVGVQLSRLVINFQECFSWELPTTRLWSAALVDFSWTKSRLMCSGENSGDCVNQRGLVVRSRSHRTSMNNTWPKEQPGNVCLRLSSKPEGWRTAMPKYSRIYQHEPPLRNKFQHLCPFHRPCLSYIEFYSLQSYGLTSSMNIMGPTPIQDEFIKEVRFSKSSEKSQELETLGAFYTPQEMKELLHFKQQLSSNDFKYLFFSSCYFVPGFWSRIMKAHWTTLGFTDAFTRQVKDPSCDWARTERSNLHAEPCAFAKFFLGTFWYIVFHGVGVDVWRQNQLYIISAKDWWAWWFKCLLLVQHSHKGFDQECAEGEVGRDNEGYRYHKQVPEQRHVWQTRSVFPWP